MADRARRGRRGGGRAARQAQRLAKAMDHEPFLTRTLQPVEVISTEALEQIEHNADTLLEEVGIEIVNIPEALDIYASAGADVDGTRVRFPRGMCRKIIQSSAPSVFTQHARNRDRSVTIGGDHMVLVPTYGPPFVRDLDGGRRSRLRQRALFAPRGLFGRLYWWLLVPFHGPIFRSMLARLGEEAEELDAGSPRAVTSSDAPTTAGGAPAEASSSRSPSVQPTSAGRWESPTLTASASPRNIRVSDEVHAPQPAIARTASSSAPNARRWAMRCTRSSCTAKVCSAAAERSEMPQRRSSWACVPPSASRVGQAHNPSPVGTPVSATSSAVERAASSPWTSWPSTARPKDSEARGSAPMIGGAS